MLSYFPRDVLDEIRDLIESVSEVFSGYSCHLHPLCFLCGTIVSQELACKAHHLAGPPVKCFAIWTKAIGGDVCVV